MEIYNLRLHQFRERGKICLRRTMSPFANELIGGMRQAVAHAKARKVRGMGVTAAQVTVTVTVTVVARMERSAMREQSSGRLEVPDFAALHPGYAAGGGGGLM
jgi:peptide deformylase